MREAGVRFNDFGTSRRAKSGTRKQGMDEAGKSRRRNRRKMAGHGGLGRYIARRARPDASLAGSRSGDRLPVTIAAQAAVTVTDFVTR